MRSTTTDVAWKRPMSNKKYSPCQTSVVWRLWIVDLRKKYSTSSILTTQNHRNKNARYLITQTKVSMWARRLSHSWRTNVLKIGFAFKIGNRKSDNFWFTSSKKTIHEHQNQQEIHFHSGKYFSTSKYSSSKIPRQNTIYVRQTCHSTRPENAAYMEARLGD